MTSMEHVFVASAIGAGNTAEILIGLKKRGSQRTPETMAQWVETA